MKKFFEGLVGLAVLIGLIAVVIWLWPSQSPAQKQASEEARVAAFSARAAIWRAELDRAAAVGIGSVGTGNLDALSAARYEVGKLFIEVADLPDGAPAWIAPCEHAASSALAALKAAQSGNMRDAPDSFSVQSQRYLAAIAACRKGMETARLG